MLSNSEASKPAIKKFTRRVMLPETEQMTPEAADIEDARKIRYGFSPSYPLNLGYLTGNRYTGYTQIFPRTLYRFEKVFPTGINENPDRLDEEREKQPAYTTVSREPRTCAEDVRSEAGERGFAIVSSLTNRADAQQIWDLLYPIEVEAEIYAMTDRVLRGPVPHYLQEWFEQHKIEVPYVKEGNALAAFIKHLETMERELTTQGLLRDYGLDPQLYDVVEATRAEMLQAANEVYQHRYSRLHASFGSIESRQNSGVGKKQLDRHDWQCIAETGIKRPEDKPVEASQRMGAAMGEKIAQQNERSESQLAQAITTLADGQQQMQQQIATQNEVIMELLRERKTQGAT